jgi:hypothetical protein
MDSAMGPLLLCCPPAKVQVDAGDEVFGTHKFQLARELLDAPVKVPWSDLGHDGLHLGSAPLGGALAGQCPLMGRNSQHGILPFSMSADRKDRAG